MDSKQFNRDRMEGLQSILADQKARLWLVDFLRSHCYVIGQSGGDASLSLVLEGQRSVFRAFVDDMATCSVQPNIRAAVYMDAIEGTYERLYDQSFSKQAQGGNENE